MTAKPLSQRNRRAVIILWNEKFDTAQISKFLAIPESRIAPVVREYVAAKKGKKASD